MMQAHCDQARLASSFPCGRAGSSPKTRRPLTSHSGSPLAARRASLAYPVAAEWVATPALWRAWSLAGLVGLLLLLP